MARIAKSYLWKAENPMSKQLSKLVILACGVMSFVLAESGCKGADPKEAEAKKEEPQKTVAKAGHVAGRVTDEAGKPIKGAEIHISGTTFGSGAVSAAEAASDAEGRYDLAVPDMLAAVQGWIETDYNGKHYRLRLDSADGLIGNRYTHDTRQGAGVDFVWKIVGAANGTSKDSRAYRDKRGGAVLIVHSMLNPYTEGKLPKTDTTAIEMTFTPDGKLIDGREGKPLTLKTPYPVTEVDDHYLIDIPLGRYTVTAKVLMKQGAGHELKLSVIPEKIGEAPKAPAASATLDFRPVPDYLGKSEGLHATEVFVTE